METQECYLFPTLVVTGWEIEFITCSIKILLLDIHELLEKLEICSKNTFAYVPAKLNGNISMFAKQTNLFYT